MRIIRKKQETTMAVPPPRWDVSIIYPSLESAEFTQALKDLRKLISELESFFDTSLDETGGDTAPEKLGPVLGETVDRLNEVYNLSGTLEAYIYAFVSTDSGNQRALRIQSEFEKLTLPVTNLETRLKARLGQIGSFLDQALEHSPSAEAHGFILKEGARLSTFLMSRNEEKLAVELSLSGGNAWNKLQSRVVSRLTAEFELDGRAKKLSMPELINLKSHPDEEVRRRAYDRENEAWNSVRDTLAACLNGVKGEVITLNKRRGRKDALEPALDQARIDRATLDAMLEAVRDSLPVFETYYRHKAKLIGKEVLAWWDIFAPVGKIDESLEFGEARNFILNHFEGFSPELREFAARAFENRWIDAEVREGKHAGGFCMEVPGVKESRILVNFDGSRDQIATLAHELGHAFHNECAYRRNKTVLQQSTPMTLAETASTFCELIVTEAVLAEVTDAEEELAVLETQLNGASQVVVDIYSRYLFETEVFQRREKAELSADEFCEIMENAQKTAFRGGIDERCLQKYMWTWKPHYYSTEVSFYNFPYTFGLLFGTGLYAVYRERGAGFVDDYKDLLASTGEASAADLALRFGIDIRTREFWDKSLGIIGERIKRYRRC
jgi:pepF/M3 family oligoendopeptidase